MIGGLSLGDEDNKPPTSTSHSSNSDFVEVDISDSNDLLGGESYSLPDGSISPQFVSDELVYSGKLNGREVKIHLDPGSQLFASVSKDLVHQRKWVTKECNSIYVHSFVSGDKSICCNRSTNLFLSDGDSYLDPLSFTVVLQLNDVILGLGWFQRYKPIIDWETFDVSFSFKRKLLFGSVLSLPSL